MRSHVSTRRANGRRTVRRHRRGAPRGLGLLALGLLALCWLAMSGCEHELRVPYIPPTLANWPQPYHGVAGLKLHAFVTGYLHVDEALLLRGGGLTRSRDLPVPVFLIEHPRQGLVLFNTGLNANPGSNADAPGSWTGLVHVDVSPRDSVKGQLQAAGFKPGAVRWIVLSNLRFDHTGEVEQFPKARVVVSKAEREYARQAPSGYVPDQFDDVSSWKFIDFASATPLATFAAHVDLFGDGSCLLIDAAGATPGTMAMMVRLPQRPVVLADDMAAVSESVRYAAQPASAHDRQEWWDHIWRLKRAKDLIAELIVVPGYDIEPLRDAHLKEIVVHDVRSPEPAAHPTPTPNVLRRLIPWPG
jgi:N-acyl homoserine lactone hydrolase